MSDNDNRNPFLGDEGWPDERNPFIDYRRKPTTFPSANILGVVSIVLFVALFLAVAP